jgi:hypothetical protein
MRYSSAIVALAAPFFVSAAPIFRRAADPGDITIAKVADVLEQFESTLYDQALKKFKDADFTAAGYISSQVVIEQLKTIQFDESTHSTFLQDTIKNFGSQPITNCQFNLDAVLKDVTTLAASARLIEYVGVSAYLGATTVLKDPRLIAAAAAIGSVEGRHQTVLNAFSSNGNSIPSAFDIPLNPSEVLALAGPFITGCDLGVPANPPLTITNTGGVGPGTLLTFQAATINGTIPPEKLFCQMIVGGASESISLPLAQCVVPSGIDGPVVIWVTKDAQPLLNNVVDRFSGDVVAGPTISFIDTGSPALNKLIISGGGAGGSPNGSTAGSTTTTTTTLSPAEASQLPGNGNSTNPTESPNPTASPNPNASPSPTALPNGTNGTAPTPVGSAGGPNMSTGPSPDGNMIVGGWSDAPPSSPSGGA